MDWNELNNFVDFMGRKKCVSVRSPWESNTFVFGKKIVLYRGVEGLSGDRIL